MSAVISAFQRHFSPHAWMGRQMAKPTLVYAVAAQAALDRGRFRRNQLLGQTVG